ncbi:MAG: type II secretion system F family protein [Candidatus Hydrogenedentes bacterium]|nr:type II secretion system F family protein [Candidatus Hydrogenedentota bacterium]
MQEPGNTTPFWKRKRSKALRQPTPYRACLYYRTRRRGWTGPRYFSETRWRSDLRDVLESLRGAVSCVMPIAGTLEVLAQATHEDARRLSPDRLYELIKYMMQALIIIAVASWILLVNAEDPDPVWVAACLAVWTAAVGYAIFNYQAPYRKEACFLVLRDRVANGATPSEAMVALPRLFPRHIVERVRIAEASGNLEHTLGSLCEETLQDIESYRLRRLTGVYLMGLFSAQIAILLFLRIKVAPVFYEIVQECAPATGIEGYMPFYEDRAIAGLLGVIQSLGSRMMLGTSRLDYALAAAFVAFLFWRFRSLSRPRLGAGGSGVMGTVCTLLPGCRRLVIAPQMALLCDLLAKLLRAGAPLPLALGLVQSAGLNPLHRAVIRRVERAVKNGNSLGEAMSGLPWPERMPNRVLQAVSLGESAGMLPEALENTAQIYRAEADGQAQWITGSMLPVGVMLLGCVNAVVVIYFFSLIFSIVEVANRWT